jgi:hypothetical protein
MATETPKDRVRLLAEADLEAFITLVQPNRVLGNCHRELIRWWTRQDAKSHQLVLLPRDHQKSALIAFRVAWEITKNPAIRILYISSTSNLATKQLKFIKDILTSDIYRYYWPEMINLDESKREKWTESEISVDHPKRKEEAVRDPTVFTAGLTTGITGLHCDVAVLDDVVVDDNAYTEDGRNKVRSQASYLASIAGTDAKNWAVGTRYHPKDLYDDFCKQIIVMYNNDGEEVSSEPLWEIYERVVEDRGDGTGQFLWPRMQRADGRWFGFNQEILAKKKAQYNDVTRFRAQYYNNPNDISAASITRDYFQYYNRSKLNQRQGRWYYGNEKLNVFAAVDFAYSVKPDADYTAIVVVGVDGKNNYYVLDIERFKTSKISDYFAKILQLYTKWGFRKLRAECTAGQSVIVKDLKENYIRVHGLSLIIEEYRPNRQEGSKQERIEATLQPRYANMQMWHYTGGNCEILEEELLLQNPPHDDVKDCLAACVAICTPPSFMGVMGGSQKPKEIFYNTRFGGIA